MASKEGVMREKATVVLRDRVEIQMCTWETSSLGGSVFVKSVRRTMSACVKSTVHGRTLGSFSRCHLLPCGNRSPVLPAVWIKKNKNKKR